MNTVEASDYFDKNLLLHQIFDSIVSNLYILNSGKKIVFANRTLLNMLGYRELSDVIGKSPKELMLCEHFEEFPCEKDPVCDYCQWNTETLADDAPKEKVIYLNKNGYSIPINVLQSLFSIEVQGETFLVVTLENITDTVRRRMLERLFFHDIINTAGALKGIIQLVKDEVPREVKADIEFVQDSFQLLIDEIQSQKHIIDAENDELILYIDKSSTRELMISVREIFLKHKVAIGKDVVIDPHSEEVLLQTDLTLLRRVLGNMLKNALEATEKNGFVRMGCRLAEPEVNMIEFWVNNKQFIPEEIQTHIFQQQISSKANERGLGTYGIKLITEKYLNGSVAFHSNEKEGTTFLVRVPFAYKPEKI